MGGFGSGFQGAASATTGEVHSLRIRDWGNLSPGAVATWRISRGGWLDLGSVHVKAAVGALMLTYTPPNCDPRPQRLDIELVACRFGGTRSWFLCPACGRRCGAVYLAASGYFCRQCCRLSYQSTREAGDTRALRKADRIRARLGWPPGIASGHGPKPKGMHWRSFWRLVAEHDRHADTFTRGSWQWLEKAHRRLERVVHPRTGGN